jgi:hypothetical protein
MSKHLGMREREARKRRIKNHKSTWAMSDRFGMVTLKLGRKKYAESMKGNRSTIQLKKKFPGCVVDAER